MPPISFIHTADWHIGKPYHRVGDADHRARLRMERTQVITRIGMVARETGARFVLVAGDLFDSPTPSASELSQALSQMGALGVPVLVIPGNHDHGGPGGVWTRPEVQEQMVKLAPNLRLLSEPLPVEVEGAVILPCPLLARNPSGDPTAWIRSLDFAQLPPGPRIVLAHGSVQGFGGEVGVEADDENPAAGVSRIELAGLPMEEVDYVALGDWHGLKEAGPRGWYAGTPEPDRFPRGDAYLAGHVLAVEAERDSHPLVTPHPTGALGWHLLSHRFNSDEDLAQLEEGVEELLGGRAGMDLIRMELSGSLSLEAGGRLESWLRDIEARLLRLKLKDATTVAPDENELRELTQRGGDPLVARVAVRLEERMADAGEGGAVARMALRELYAACVRMGSATDSGRARA